PLSKWGTARPCCLRLLVHLMRLAASRTFCTAGRIRPSRTAMIAITTSSCTSVKAGRPRLWHGPVVARSPDRATGRSEWSGRETAPQQRSLRTDSRRFMRHLAAKAAAGSISSVPCSLLLSVCLRWAGAGAWAFRRRGNSHLSCRLFADHVKEDLMIPEGRVAVYFKHLIRLCEQFTRLLVLADAMVRHGSETPDNGEERRWRSTDALFLKLLDGLGILPRPVIQRAHSRPRESSEG